MFAKLLMKKLKKLLKTEAKKAVEGFMFELGIKLGIIYIFCLGIRN